MIFYTKGGLFGSWTLLTSADTFRNFILCSPSFWWNQEEIWSIEELRASRKSELTADVFLSAGTLETAEGSRTQLTTMSNNLDGVAREGIDRLIAAYDQYGWPRMSEICTEFAERLRARAYPNLRIHCHNLPDESHTSGSPRGYRTRFSLLVKRLDTMRYGCGRYLAIQRRLTQAH